jgi:hypothetical protein
MESANQKPSTAARSTASGAAAPRTTSHDWVMIRLGRACRVRGTAQEHERFDDSAPCEPK